MKILVIHEVNYLSKIIYEFQILPELLSILGHEVVIIDYNDSWNSETNGNWFHLRPTLYEGIHRAYPGASVTVRRPGQLRLPVLARISGALTAGVEVVRAMQQNRPDVVLLYGMPTVGVQALLAARSFGVPVVFRAIDVSHELAPNALLSSVTRVFEDFVFNGVDFNIALTPHLKSYILSYGVPQRNIRLLPSGVDTAMFSPGLRNDALMRSWGIDPGDPVILFMGTIYKFSGLDRVILDFSKVLSSYPSARLLVVGTGEDEQRLRAMAQSMGLSGNVIFTGMQPYSILPDVIRSSDLCINPFELNGVTENILPTKLFQYMTCAKPVLATSLPGTRTFLEGEGEGVVYATLDDFNEQLTALLSNPARRQELGRNGLRVAQNYDWRSIAQTMASWLAEVA